MNKDLLIGTAHKLFVDSNGLLSMDASNTTCNRRFALLDMPQTDPLQPRCSPQ